MYIPTLDQAGATNIPLLTTDVYQRGVPFAADAVVDEPQKQEFVFARVEVRNEEAFTD